MSESQEGLQTSMEGLHSYANKWGLQINVNKTKSMIFTKNGYNTEKLNIMCGTEPIEKVTNYTYLGVNFNTNGSMDSTMTRLAEKARRAEKAQTSILNADNNTTSIKTKLFETTQIPILTYAGEMWGLCTNKKWDTTSYMY
ncbi:uncharacterized protein LOC144359875 [Saccoglossus kowalevskii]